MYGGNSDVASFAEGNFNDIHIANLNDLSWTKLSDIKGTPPKSTWCHGSFLLNNKLFIFGGYNEMAQPAPFSEMHCFDLGTIYIYIYKMISLYKETTRGLTPTRQ
jgi:hypothetical protein